MRRTEMTIDEVLRDPLIQLMMRADGVSPQAMRTLLTDAALAQRNRIIRRPQRHGMGNGTDQLHNFQSPRDVPVAVRAGN
jgi:hypothetical protein